MFFQLSNLHSSSVSELSVNPKTNQVVVKYNGNDKTYLYSDVEFGAIAQLLMTTVTSIGKWVNVNLKQNEDVTYYAV